MLALVYIHMQMKIIHLAYEGTHKQKSLVAAEPAEQKSGVLVSFLTFGASAEAKGQ
jgi:hypothetical protein